MKTLYLECGMGAAGDMLMAALYELLDDKEFFIKKMDDLNLAKVRPIATEKCGVVGTRMSITFDGVEEQPDGIHEHIHNLNNEHHHEHNHEHHDNDHHHEHDHEHNYEHHDNGHHHEHDHEHNRDHHDNDHHHSDLNSITHIIRDLDVSENVRQNALAVYNLIAEAESLAHGKPITDVHFHEVGTKDAVADIVGVSLLMELLASDKIIASPICTGSGFVRSAHGVLPVPAPATAFILRGVPIFAGDISSELCTPTGAALLKHFVLEYKSMPAMSVDRIGYGMGKKDFHKANCVRAFAGQGMEVTPPATAAQSYSANAFGNASDRIDELSCNLDDMTGEAIGYAVGILLSSGALDVYTTPIMMKKNRPAIVLTVLSPTDKTAELSKLMMKHTTTFGVRARTLDRYILNREIHTVSTQYGDVRVKCGEGHGARKHKIEYDDAAKAAKAYGIDLMTVIHETERIYAGKQFG
ncbi:MAG: nickel pincer cofactor biosynthesis protein LarC [Clostridiales bacterium]|jgi:uncharacterized protein (TIGR00299 family) protein|nr:nickel pincer cofactor biosynthesis protein LarC [Clostridiales bacterium]